MAWWHKAKPGDPIVCLVDLRMFDGLGFLLVKPLVKGRVYTVRNFDYCEIVNVACVRLEGVENSIAEDVGREKAYWAKWFRPAEKTDLPEELTQLLDVPASKELERA